MYLDGRCGLWLSLMRLCRMFTTDGIGDAMSMKGLIKKAMYNV